MVRRRDIEAMRRELAAREEKMAAMEADIAAMREELAALKAAVRESGAGGEAERKLAAQYDNLFRYNGSRQGDVG